MQDLFYSEDAYREYQDDLMSDGYSNEYQRVYAQSQMSTEVPNERALADRLHAQGLYVVCGEYEVCCPVTDGLIGYAWVVEKTFTTREEVDRYLDQDAEGIFLYQPAPARVEPVAIDETDSIPF